jgi:glucose/arabinose dehydrogenase
LLFDDLPAGFLYADFADPTGLVLNGAAVVAGTALRVSDSLGPAGSVFHALPLALSPAQSFATYFSFAMAGGDGLDGAGGLTFLLQNSAAGTAALGEGGSQLGLGAAAPGTGIGNSLAIEFDTGRDPWDVNGNHVAVVIDGAVDAATGEVNPGFKLNSGAVRHVWIDYDGAIDRLSVTIGTTATRPADVTLVRTVDLHTLLDGEAFLGFTAGAGAPGNDHDILAWEFGPGSFPIDPENPAAPVITEPGSTFRINPGDVNITLTDFIDPDGDTHLASDFAIFRAGEALPAWEANGITGLLKTRVDLSDGVFLNTHAGRSELFAGAEYEVRARFIDSEGNAGAWSAKPFSTAKAQVIQPLAIDDVWDATPPTWTEAATGALVDLDDGARMKVAQANGGALLTFTDNGTDGYRLKNPGARAAEGDVELILTAGAADLVLDVTRLLLESDRGVLDIYLPAMTLAAGTQARFWVADNGSTYLSAISDRAGTFETLAQGTLTPWKATLDGYVIEEVAGGYQLPVAIAFAPTQGTDPADVSYYVVELYGTIKAVLSDGSILTYAEHLLDFNPTGDFPGTGEMGVASLAIDPASGDLFITRVGIASDGSGDLVSLVERLHSEDGGRSMAQRSVVLEMLGAPQRASHQVSNITIGPDGHLYVHVGDAFQAQEARDLTDWRGKIIRLDLSGAAVPDNPFYDAADGITATDYIYAYGFRNPFGGAWRESDGAHYTVENGESINDRLSRLDYGFDYGWTGAGGFSGDEASMTTGAIYNWVPTHAPVNITFIQSSVFGGSQFPTETLDMAFVTESGSTWATGPQARGKRIVGFAIDADGTLIDGPIPFAEYDGSGKGTAIAIAAGPDGLYFSDLYRDLDYATPIDPGAKIWRLRYVGT